MASIVLTVHFRLYQYAFDDAYIHFRIARNFVETGSPYFNSGEIVKVSTSSGWMLFLTAIFAAARIFRLEPNFPLIIAIINSFISMGSVIVYTQILRNILREHLSQWMIVLFQICLTALLLPASIGMMETPFALLITGAGILLLLKSKPSGFALLGLAVNIRIELIVLLVSAGIILALRRQFNLLPILGYSAAGLIPILAFDLYFFQTIIPHSIISKSIVYSRTWFETVLEILLYSLPDYGLRLKSLLLGLGVITLSSGMILSATAVFEWRKSKPIWLALFFLWSLVIIGGYSLGKTLLFVWYIPLYSTPLLVTIILLSARMEYPRHYFIRGFLYIILLLSTISLTRTVIAAVGNPKYFSQFEPGSRVKQYLRIGKILNDEYPQATLLTSEIGGLGYTFEGKILDAAGLASPQALVYHPMTVPGQRLSGILGAIPPEYVSETNPKLIVSYDVFSQALLKDDVVYQYNVLQIPAYSPEDEVYTDSEQIWGSQYLRIYVRKDLPISEKITTLGK